ncbi:HEPN domain-containing protein [Bernardetia sp. MNP-M8]|uniref:HEPN domain-containing protein n=1 Tax=Bernardetia sp. MNP-M8 TaxID=3127470 RepID=UPI0030D47247
MNTQKKLFGKIYHPEKSDEIIEGVWLEITDNDIRIQVPNFTFRQNKWEVIKGEFTGLDKVSFIDVYPNGDSSGAGGSFDNLSVSFLLKGVHIDIKNQLNLTKFTIFSKELTKWVRTLPINNKKEEDKLIFEIPQTQQIIQLNSSYQGKDVSLSLYTGYDKYWGTMDYAIKVDKVAYFEVHFKGKNKWTFTDIFQLTILLENFILFVIHANPQIFETHIFYEKELSNKVDSTTVFSDTDEGGSELVRRSSRAFKPSYSFTFTYGDIEPFIKIILNKWLSESKLHPIITLLQSHNYNSSLPSSTYFFNMCSAIEALHTNLLKDRFQETSDKKKQEMKKQRNAIKKLIDDDNLKAFFIEKAGYWSKLSLRERISSWKEELEKITKSVFINTVYSSIDDLIDMIVKTRNDIAHNGLWNKRIENEFDLYLVSKSLELLLKYEIAIFIGYPKDKCERLLEKSNKILVHLRDINA